MRLVVNQDSCDYITKHYHVSCFFFKHSQHIKIESFRKSLLCMPCQGLSLNAERKEKSYYLVKI